jgi:hypothetical protein
MLRLAQYLGTLRALPREGPPVQVLVIAPAALRASFEQALVSDARLVFRTVDMSEAARKVGIKHLPADAAGEQLFLHLAVRSAPKEQFARVEDRRSYFLWRLQRAIAFTGVAGFAACLIFAGLRTYDLFSEKGQISTLRQETQEATLQYERKTATFPVTQTTTDNLKATVVEFTRIAGQSSSPEPALAYLSQVVEKFPQMEIESVQWRIGKSEGRDAAVEAPGTAVKPVAAAGTGAGSAPGMMQILEVSGHVNATKRSDYRAITGQVQQFAEGLRSDPSWRILRTVLPFDITPEGTLSGDIGLTEGTEAPRFSVTVGKALR